MVEQTQWLSGHANEHLRFGVGGSGRKYVGCLFEGLLNVSWWLFVLDDRAAPGAFSYRYSVLHHFQGSL